MQWILLNQFSTSLLLNGLLMGVYIYINYKNLPLRTGSWNSTSCMCISWYLCEVSKVTWWLNSIYRYWVWVPLTHSTTFNLTFNWPIILSHVRKRYQYMYWRAYPYILQWKCNSYGKVQLPPLSNPFFKSDPRWLIS